MTLLQLRVVYADRIQDPVTISPFVKALRAKRLSLFAARKRKRILKKLKAISSQEGMADFFKKNKKNRQRNNQTSELAEIISR